MSQENIDFVRSICAAWERGDFSMDGWAHPDIDFEAIGDTPTAGSRKGRAGMSEAWREWLGAWAEFHTEAQEFHEIDEERVLVLTRFGGRGKTSGLEVGHMWTRGASLFHVRDDSVTRLALYTDHERALADLGLTAEDVRPASEAP